MTTILGSHISNIRPSVPYRCRVYKNELPRARYRIKPTTILNEKVRFVCVKTVGGSIFSLSKGTHIDVMNTFNLSPEQIIATGWMLENREFLWR